MKWGVYRRASRAKQHSECFIYLGNVEGVQTSTATANEPSCANHNSQQNKKKEVRIHLSWKFIYNWFTDLKKWRYLTDNLVTLHINLNPSSFISTVVIQLRSFTGITTDINCCRFFHFYVARNIKRVYSYASVIK